MPASSSAPTTTVGQAVAVTTIVTPPLIFPAVSDDKPLGNSTTTSQPSVATTTTQPPVTTTTNPANFPSSSPRTTVVAISFNPSLTSEIVGDKLQLGGESWPPFSEVAVTMFSTPTPLGTFPTNANGAFSAEVPVPLDKELGIHRLEGETIDGKYRASSQVSLLSLGIGQTIEAADASASLANPAFTGSSSRSLILFGVLLIFMGFTLSFISIKHRRKINSNEIGKH